MFTIKCDPLYDKLTKNTNNTNLKCKQVARLGRRGMATGRAVLRWSEGLGYIIMGIPLTYVIDTTVLIRKKFLVTCTNFIVFFTGFIYLICKILRITKKNETNNGTEKSGRVKYSIGTSKQEFPQFATKALQLASLKSY